MKLVFNNVKRIIIFIVTVIIGYGVIGNLSSINDSIYSVTCFRNYVVLTGSMEPSISPGDYITIAKINPKNLQVNDIVSYKKNGAVITHQIIEIKGDSIKTQGTANNVADNPINKNEVLGKYLFKIPKVGYIITFFNSTSGLIIIIGLIALIVFLELSKPKNGEKGNENKNQQLDNK